LSSKVKKFFKKIEFFLVFLVNYAIWCYFGGEVRVRNLCH